VVCDTFEDMVEIDLRIQPVEFGGAEQRVDGCGTFATGVGSCEQEILASERDDAQRAFGGVVVGVQSEFGK
jgi:hypothetical protein